MYKKKIQILFFSQVKYKPQSSVKKNCASTYIRERVLGTDTDKCLKADVEPSHYRLSVGSLKSIANILWYICKRVANGSWKEILEIPENLLPEGAEHILEVPREIVDNPMKHLQGSCRNNSHRSNILAKT